MNKLYSFLHLAIVYWCFLNCAEIQSNVLAKPRIAIRSTVTKSASTEPAITNSTATVSTIAKPHLEDKNALTAKKSQKPNARIPGKKRNLVVSCKKVVKKGEANLSSSKKLQSTKTVTEKRAKARINRDKGPRILNYQLFTEEQKKNFGMPSIEEPQKTDRTSYDNNPRERRDKHDDEENDKEGSDYGLKDIEESNDDDRALLDFFLSDSDSSETDSNQENSSSDRRKRGSSIGNNKHYLKEGIARLGL